MGRQKEIFHVEKIQERGESGSWKVRRTQKRRTEEVERREKDESERGRRKMGITQSRRLWRGVDRRERDEREREGNISSRERSNRMERSGGNRRERGRCRVECLCVRTHVSCQFGLGGVRGGLKWEENGVIEGITRGEA